MLRYQLSAGRTLILNYRTQTNAPSASQLQQAIDNSNPLLLSSGNPDLKQAYSHRLALRYQHSSPNRGTTLYATGNLVHSRHYIGSATYTHTPPNDLQLPTHGQYTRPENMDGYWNARLQAGYSIPLQKPNANLSMDIKASYQQEPSSTDGVQNAGKRYSLSHSIGLGNRSSPRLDYQLSLEAQYNYTLSQLEKIPAQRYTVQVARLRVDWHPGSRWTLGQTLLAQTYQGLDGLGEYYIQWNLYAGRLFGKADRYELRVSAFDLLGQNTSLSQTLEENYLEQRQSLVLGRYLMCSLRYRFQPKT